MKSLLLVTVGGKELLVSGSADATLGVWDTQTGERLHTLKGHGRAILALALDPGAGDDADTVQAESDTVRIFSASSDRLIKTWHLTPTRASMHLGNILAHETSIDALHFDSNGDLWTASADKTAKCLSRSRNWQPDTSLEHPDFVRDVYVDEVGGFVVTACRDEEVRVWEAGSGKLVHVYEGHYEEVIGLCGRVVDGKRVVVSVGIDGGVRRWGVGQKEVAEAVKRREEEGKGVEKVEEKKESMLTEEEERELAELMGESDGE